MVINRPTTGKRRAREPPGKSPGMAGGRKADQRKAGN